MTFPKRYVLLINLGTPDAPKTLDVRRYLGEFLMDPFVIDIPQVLRWLLVKGIIVNTRSHKSAEAYRKIWTPDGSPLLTESRAFQKGLSEILQNSGSPWKVWLAMRYGSPSIASVLQEIQQSGAKDVLVWALYPQYAESSTKTAEVKVLDENAKLSGGPMNLTFIPAFYNHPAYEKALADVTKFHLEKWPYDQLLMTFHGLPKAHVTKLPGCAQHCFKTPTCCDSIIEANQMCYRAQCFHTARTLARALDIPSEKWSVSFQSRLGPKWIEPFTDHVIPQLAAQGVQRLAVISPAFVADCLETLEELNIRGRDLFMNAGGKEYFVVPCLNADPKWIQGAQKIIQSCST